MENNQRMFQPVNIGMTSVETGQERFTKNEVCSLPPISYWRNNLTGLSQRYNLYFVATGEDIIVYRPEFPFQKLNSTPQLLIPPTLANHRAEGYINPAKPHAINTLLIGDLGTEEVILVATDSGNVAGYHTKSIIEAIKKDPYRFSTNARSDYVGVRAFFSQWVYESAWGLAIHSNARMITVSANTPHHVRFEDLSAKITVFAFALHLDEENEGATSENFDHERDFEESEWHDWDYKASGEGGPTRQRNYKITLAGPDGHRNNIPCVSFVNSADDRDGQWLLSTDIAGDMKIWRIWRGICYKSWNFSDRSRTAFPWLRDTQGGWLVAALDTYAFRPASSMAEFCGHSKWTQYHGYRDSGKSYNISNIVRLRTPGNSLSHPAINESSEEDDDSDADDESGGSIEPWSETEDLEVTEDTTTIGESRSEPRGSASRAFPDNNLSNIIAVEDNASRDDPGSKSHPDSDTFESTSDSVQQETANSPGSPRPFQAQLVPESAAAFESESEYLSDEYEYQLEVDTMETFSESELSEDIPSVSNRSATSISSLAQRNSADVNEAAISDSSNQGDSVVGHPEAYGIPSKYKIQTELGESQQSRRQLGHIPSFPALHCTTSHLRLLKVPEKNDPHVFCANILKQMLPDVTEASPHARFDRLNMIQQVPELGIVLIATQIGRCAVCSLTKNVEHDTFGLRVDWTLPTKRQERAGIRPIAPLLGIAVGPIQGQMEVREEQLSEDSSEEQWGKDGIFEGVKVSFASDIVKLSDNSIASDEDLCEEENTTGGWNSARRDGQRDDRATKRTRLSSSSSPGSNPSGISLEKRPWLIPATSQPWRATENSRRFRLMMTYADMTVLTYEMSRNVERDDVQ